MAANATAAICEVGGGGLLLPFSDGEQKWNKTGRAFIYFAALLWCFLGVSIVADIFMAAIEAVTSKKKDKKLSNGRTIAVKVWNETVANLTLMALGSSAPEILLSVIELFANEMYAGELGPSTIVGSAAFNLLCIIAVCVYVIPDGEKRTIKQPVVFAITATFSVFAYLWLIIILALSSPDLVTPAEGVFSFLFFPILVVIAYLADIGKLGGKSEPVTNEKIDDLRAYMLEHGENVTEEDLKTMCRVNTGEQKSRAQLRLQVTKGTANGKAIEKVCDERDLAVGFMSTNAYFTDGATFVNLDVEKSGFAALAARVDVDFVIYDRNNSVVKMDKVHLMPGQQSATLRASIPSRLELQDGDKTAGDKNNGSKEEGDKKDEEKFFWVDMVRASYQKDDSPKPHRVSVYDHQCIEAMARLKDKARVVITEDRARAKVYMQPKGEAQHGAGQLRMQMSEVTHKPSRDKQTNLQVLVQRFNGSDGELKCRFRTEAATARVDGDFFMAEGVLTFPDQVMHQVIEVKIETRSTMEAADTFFVIISNEDDGNPVVDPEASSCCVTIAAITEGAMMGAAIVRGFDAAVNLDAFAEGNYAWKNQFIMAMRPVNGDEDDAAEATVADWTIHFVALPWKLFFAMIPPASYCGGWLCFCIALVFIGGVTAVIGDLASLMGCCLDLPDAITAITIVALGTSLPDTFASKVAAVEEPTADAAIGNVTGSNSVNVFLGLGLPWMIASIYWAAEGQTGPWRDKYPELKDKYKDGGFAVIAGDLVFSVIIFTMCSCTALAVIVYRRRAFQAELGGPKGVKTNTAIFFVMLWLFYVALASWKVQTPDADEGMQVVATIVGVMGIGVGMVVIAGIIHCISGMRSAQQAAAKDHIEAALWEHQARLDNFQQAALKAAATNGIKASPGGNGSLSRAVSELRAHLNGLDQVCSSLEAAVAAQQKVPLVDPGPNRRSLKTKATE